MIPDECEIIICLRGWRDLPSMTVLALRRVNAT